MSSHSIRGAEQLHRLVMEVGNAGVPMGIVLFPLLDSPLERYKLGFLHDRVMEECSASKIPGLDLRQAYSGFSAEMSVLWANPLDSLQVFSAMR